MDASVMYSHVMNPRRPMGVSTVPGGAVAVLVICWLIALVTPVVFGIYYCIYVRKPSSSETKSLVSARVVSDAESQFDRPISLLSGDGDGISETKQPSMDRNIPLRPMNSASSSAASAPRFTIDMDADQDVR